MIPVKVHIKEHPAWFHRFDAVWTPTILLLDSNADAGRWYNDVIRRFPHSHAAPGAMYWQAASNYKATNDHTVLGKAAVELRSKYPTSVWASKASPWLPTESQKEVA